MSGCGAWQGQSDSETSAETDLLITVWPQGKGEAKTWTLRCRPTGGSLPNADSACGSVTEKALRPLPRDIICTQVYGGPQKARVTGRIAGRQVDSRFSRTNGCEIHRWDSVRYLFPVRI